MLDGPAMFSVMLSVVPSQLTQASFSLAGRHARPTGPEKDKQDNNNASNRRRDGTPHNRHARADPLRGKGGSGAVTAGDHRHRESPIQVSAGSQQQAFLRAC
jgi:hypothetical protein